eukprot:4993275-Prorocentrum_lima.AAC.1
MVHEVCVVLLVGEHQLQRPSALGACPPAVDTPPRRPPAFKVIIDMCSNDDELKSLSSLRLQGEEDF